MSDSYKTIQIFKNKTRVENVDARYFIVIRVTRNFCLERDHPGTIALNTKNIIFISSSFILVVVAVVSTIGLLL